MRPVSVLDFIAAMTKALAWPAAAAVIAWLFREQLRSLLSGGAHRVKAGPFEVEWEHQVVSAQAEVEPSEPLAGAAFPSTEAATLAPIESIVRTHNRIENELRQALLDSGVPAEELTTNVTALARRAARIGIISEETYRAMEGLVRLRNLAVHRPDEVDEERAHEYLSIAEAALYAMDTETRRRSRFGMTGHQTRGGVWKLTVHDMTATGEVVREFTGSTWDEAMAAANAWVHEQSDSDGQPRS